ncbi:MAG: GspE/PulE family protein [Elusimicrobiota bacterium]|mgnify:CR=1 FL=1
MAKPLSVFWNTCRGQAWCELFAIDLEGPHFDGMEGVYVVWYGGRQPQILRIGQGLVRDRIREDRVEPEILKHRDEGLFVTWAKVERVARDGVFRFLVEALQPKLKAEFKPVLALVVNLPGQAPAEGSVQAGPPPEAVPEQAWEDMLGKPGDDAALSAKPRPVEPPKPPPPPPPAPEKLEAPPAPVAAVPTPKPKPVTNLQRLFNELTDKMRPKGKTGFFGATTPKPEDDAFVHEAVALIMKEAMSLRASDIHLEPQEAALRVRFRIDGIMESVLEVPHALNIRVVSHICVTCGMDPEKGVGTGKPQDGRMAVNVEGQDADLRLSTFPTAYGDKAVLRIIPRKRQAPKLEELGLSPKVVETMNDLIHRPQGMIIVTGPTGSGKSTTLYTALQALNEPVRNIVTLEDPIELKIPGITQGFMNIKAGFTFSAGLRAILRQDPNVIMVGEIRDLETAEIAMSAALTGHMLFTTLHTNSALGAVTRLLDMGLEPFLISSALTAVFAQRLARRNCLECKEPHTASAAEKAEVEALARRGGVPLPAGFYQGLARSKGCKACRETGFTGRLLLSEIVTISTALRQLILRKAPMAEMREVALKEGAQTMLLDGLEKAAAGATTLGELVRVVGETE